MTEMIKNQLDRIEKMDSVMLQEFRESVIKYSVPGKAKTTILDAIELKLKAYDRSAAMVEETDMSDMSGH